MHYKNIVNICSGIFICLVAFTAIARSEGEEMNPLTLEDLLKFNTFVGRVPIDITSDGNWIAYNTQNREQYEGGGGNSAYSKTGVMIEMAYGTIWVTNTRTGEHRNLTPDSGSSWAPRWSPQGTHLAFFQIGWVSLTYSSGIENPTICKSSHRKPFGRSLALRCLNGHQMDSLFFLNPFPR